MTDKWNLRDDLLAGSLLLLSEEDQSGENVRRDHVQIAEELREKASNLSKWTLKVEYWESCISLSSCLLLSSCCERESSRKTDDTGDPRSSRRPASLSWSLPVNNPSPLQPLSYRCLQFLGAKPDFFIPLELLQNRYKEKCCFFFARYFLGVIFCTKLQRLHSLRSLVFVKFTRFFLKLFENWKSKSRAIS